MKVKKWIAYPHLISSHSFKTVMGSFSIFLLLVLFCGAVNAQLPKATKVDWIKTGMHKGVEFYYAIGTCENTKSVFLKFVNKNNYPVKATWNELFQTKQVPELKAGFEGTKKMVLQVGETFPIDCNDPKKGSLILSALRAIPTYNADIEKFAFSDISITPLSKK